jgi:arylsulfatase A
MKSIFALVVLAFVGAARAAESPNIVFILADDMGYGDVHALNPDSKIPTPNLDALAKAGMTFTDAHTPSSVCTPTRYALLTGRYCWRGRLKRGVQNGYGPRLIENDRQTVASLLKAVGYHTGIIGKWHLGLGWTKKRNGVDLTVPIKDTPNVFGFDHSYVIPASLDFPPYVYIHNDKVTDPTTVEQQKQGFPAYLRSGPRSNNFVMDEALDHLTEKASDYIKARAKTDKPFFLYFPLTAPHKPVLPHKRFRGKTKLNDYGDFVTQVDWVVGQIHEALADAGVRDDTLVIYTSDNASFMHRLDKPGEKDHVDDPTIQAYRAENHRANGPWRGTKADIWEGGHHVPFFAMWPGRIKADSKSARTICLTDFMATVAQITGAKIDKNAGEDSYSLLAALEQKDTNWARPPVIHHSSGGMFAIRDGKWKLVAGNGSGGRQKPKGKPFGKPFHLFDMEKDAAETTNLIDKYPDVAERLTKALETIRTSGRSVVR